MKLKSNQPKASAEQVVKDIRRATRRHYSTEDKIRIVLSGLRGEDSIAELCRKEGIAGIRALLVHAKDEPARLWYLKWEFEPSPSDPFHLFLLMKDIKATVGKA